MKYAGSNLTLFYPSLNVELFNSTTLTLVWEEIYKIEYNVILYLSANLEVFLAHPLGGGRNMRDQI